MIEYLDSWRIRVKNAHRNLLLFAAGAALMGFAGSMFDTTFNNFLSDSFDITARGRGFLEFPRELPGFLTALLPACCSSRRRQTSPGSRRCAWARG